MISVRSVINRIIDYVVIIMVCGLLLFMELTGIELEQPFSHFDNPKSRRLGK